MLAGITGLILGRNVFRKKKRKEKKKKPIAAFLNAAIGKPNVEGFIAAFF